MSLDSWIDDQALSMMRALAPDRGTEPPAREPALDFGFDPVSDGEASLPESGEPARIAPPAEPDPGAIQRLRSRLAEIRRRAESGGVVRTSPARITPSVPVEPPPAEANPGTTNGQLEGREATKEPEPATKEPEPAAESPESSEADENIALPAPPVAHHTPPSPPTSGAAISPPPDQRVLSPFSIPDPVPPVADSRPAPLPVPEDEPAPPARTLPASEVRGARPAGLEIPEGPLAVRLDAYRRWLEAACGLAKPVVFDRHGCPLHAAEGLSSFIAAAVSLGIAWREACALTDPPGTLRAVHSAWGTGTMAVIPVPTRFGDLYVAGQVGAAIEPEMAAEIGSALRRAAGV